MIEPTLCQPVATIDSAPSERALQERALQERALQERALSARASVECVPVERALALAERILVLCEPWRSRFVAMAAQYAGANEITGADTDTDCGAGRERDVVGLGELAGWLADADLHERIRLLLRAWISAK